ncbi:MAG: hypothetical protein JXA33_20940 [Anaerolineae bacterium]|nr:hypothetical protein [Anaerolineae bacterium]
MPNLQKLSLDHIVEACAHESSRVHSLEGKPSTCYELFRRACTPPFDNAAWQAVYDQYHRQVRLWLSQYASDDTVQETFLRFFQVQQNVDSPFPTRYADISAIIAYLKRCAIAVRIGTWREEDRQRVLMLAAYTGAIAPQGDCSPETPHAVESFKVLVRTKLKDERERTVFELSYTHGLTPREIQAQHPALFPTVQDVYRARENMLKRLRRDAELREWWRDG